MDWKGIWEDIVNFFSRNIWNILLFIVVFFVGRAVVKLLINFVKKMFAKSKMEGITQGFLIAIVRVVLWLVLVLILLSIIGIQVSGIVTALSAVVLAVGMALQNIIANVANGIVIVTSKIFKKGDYVEANGASGSVTHINFLFTTITTPDNKRVTIPNSEIINNNVTNYGSNDSRRVEFTFSVAYESDVEKVKQIVTDVIKSNGSVYLDPEPFCRLKTLNASSLDFFCHCWCDRGDYWDVYYYVVENVYNEFKRNGISVPYNQIEVRERKDVVKMPVIGDGIPERVEKIRNKKNRKIDLENIKFSEILNIKKKGSSNKKSKKNTKASKETTSETKTETEAKSETVIKDESATKSDKKMRKYDPED